jgi:hypothetical protein
MVNRNTRARRVPACVSACRPWLELRRGWPLIVPLGQPQTRSATRWPQAGRPTSAPTASVWRERHRRTRRPGMSGLRTPRLSGRWASACFPLWARATFDASAIASAAVWHRRTTDLGTAGTLANWWRQEIRRSAREDSREPNVAPDKAGFVGNRRAGRQCLHPLRRRPREAVLEDVPVAGYELAVAGRVAYAPAKPDLEWSLVAAQGDRQRPCIGEFAIARAHGCTQVTERVPALHEDQPAAAAIQECRIARPRRIGRASRKLESALETRTASEL